MPSETTETLELAAAESDPAQRYSLRRDRCVVEVSLRLLGLPLVRARLRARGGDLVVTGDAPEPGPGLDRSPSAASAQVDLYARPVRITPPLALLFRDVPRRRRLTFTAADIDLPMGAQQAHLDGEVIVTGWESELWSLPLSIRVLPTEDATILLTAQGPVRPRRTIKSPLARLVRLPWLDLWLDAAAEFSR